MTAQVVRQRRQGAVLRVVGASGQVRRVPRTGSSPVRSRSGPTGPPRRHDDRRWETDLRGWTDV
ncbi:hypothetical protein EYA84_29975 [Verrucosispora sp. SN26_14.1]|nr:hypothetical protein EYA84_29975 [Verrucosispora sp. SN26_14.1]